jgi:PmbA protein
VAELADLARRIVGWGRAGEEVEAYMSWGRETAVRVYDGEVEQLSSAESAGAGIRVVTGGRQGFAYAGSLDEPELAAALADARDNASFATSDPHVGLPGPDGVPPADLDLWRPELEALPTTDKVAMAMDLEARIKAADPRIRQVEQANFGDTSRETAVASTTGIDAASRRSSCFLAAYAIAGDGDQSQSAGGYSVGRSPSDLDPDQVVRDAVERAIRLLGARQTRSARLTVVLDPRVTTALLGVVAAALSGDAVHKRRSFLADRLGEQIALPSVTLVDDPTNQAAYGASSQDAEGLACRRNEVVSAGVLRMFVQDSYSGRRAGVSSTGSAVRGGFKTTPGPGCRAFRLVPGALSPEELLAQVGEGFYVQSVSGVHSGTNPASGDFSVGAEGLMVRDGALAEPVREVTIASTIPRMLQRVVAIGDDLLYLPGMAAGLTVAVADVSLSGA